SSSRVVVLNGERSKSSVTPSHRKILATTSGSASAKARSRYAISRMQADRSSVMRPRVLMRNPPRAIVALESFFLLGPATLQIRTTLFHLCLPKSQNLFALSGLRGDNAVG